MEFSMRITSWITIVLLGLACSVPSHAQQLSGPAARLDAQLEAMFERGEWLKGVVTEEDVSLLFAHLRAVLLATSTGAPPPVASVELNRRLEAIGKELKGRGMLVGLLLLNSMEAQAKELVREAPARSVPPARP
jgi:hypothetical protein